MSYKADVSSVSPSMCVLIMKGMTVKFTVISFMIHVVWHRLEEVCNIFQSNIMRCPESVQFSYYTHNHFGQYAKQRNNCYLSNRWDISCCIAKKASDCILYHAIENSVANTINVTYMQCTMGVIPSSLQQPFCIWIGCSFCGIT